jgi:hypothetical protein
MIELDTVKEKAEEMLRVNQKIEILPVGFMINNKVHFYGFSGEKDCFIISEKGEVPSKSEAMPLYKSFLQAENILGENFSHFEQGSQRSMAIFEQLSIRLKKINHIPIKEDIEAIVSVVVTINELQDDLRNRCLELKGLKKDIKDNGYFDEEDLQRLKVLNNDTNFMLYRQVLVIYNAAAPIRKVLQYMEEGMSLKQKLSPNTILAKAILKRFITKRMQTNIQKQLLMFERNDAESNADSEIKGDLDLLKISKNLTEKFNMVFRNSYREFLINE